MYSLKKKTIPILILGINILTSFSLYAEKITIKGFDITYNELTQTMIASGNAELKHPDFTIYADKIIYHQKSNQVIGKDNVEMIQENQIIFSDKFYYNTKSNVILIDNLTIELTTKVKNQQIFVSANSFSDHQKYKTGKMGLITTCDYNPPHYYLHAESFTIYPEKRIIGQNVTFVNPIFFIPFGFWSPAYIFDLGKRRVIYLMPVIGSNKVEGSFIKSQIDYVLNDNWFGEAYIDYLSEKGIGLGTLLKYDNLDNLEGNIYYYSVTDTEDNIKEWNQTLKVSPNETVKTQIQSKNIYLVQGGYYSKDKNYIEHEKITAKGSQRTSYQFEQSKLSNIKPKSYKINYYQNSDDNSSLKIGYSKSETSINKEEVNLSNKSYIGHDIMSSNNFNYNQQNLSAVDRRNDSYLKTENSLSKSFKDFGTVVTSIDYYFDTDSDTVTSDIKNHIVQKIPELELRLNKYELNKNWNVNQDFQYGYYTEYYYQSEIEQQREYSQSRFKINSSLNGLYNYKFLNGKLDINTSYNQYFYASGDQNYTLGNTTRYTTDSFSFLKTETSHNRVWVPENGNTPFYFDERVQMEKNEVKETITLYLLNPEKYAFKYSSGYNWIVDYQLDNQFELKINPSPQIKTLFKTTYLIQQRKYSTLVNRFDYIPNRMFSTSLQANYDLNIGEMINLNHTLSGSTSKNWENRWVFNAYFTYAPRYNQDYQLQTLSLTKDLHERQLTLIYNRIIEEYRFQFTINAMPENKVGFTSNKYESFRLEGVFDDESIQR